MNLGTILSCKGASVATIDISWSLQAAAALMMRGSGGALVVTDHGKPVGLVSERDLVNALADKGSRVARTPIREVLTHPALAVSVSESVMRALTLMTERRLRHLPVFDDNELIGVVTLRDLIKYRLQEIELEAMSSATWLPQSGSGNEGSFSSDEPSATPRSLGVPEVSRTSLEWIRS